jgi:flagellar basal-body rod modification protein FlgD
MTQIQTNAASFSGTTQSTTSATQAGGTLDKNAFLMLMMSQLKNQDPLNPSDPTQYVSELAQFTSLEQETNIAQTSSTQAAEQNNVSALSLLGHTVTYTDSTGATQTGLVQKVDFTSSGPSLTIAGKTGITPSSVTEVS